MLSSDSDILTQAEAWRRGGRAVALATVVETWGSAPRPVGRHLVIGDGRSRMLEFGVADETAWRSGLSCGGRIKVFGEKGV